VKQALKCQVSSATTTSRQLDQRYDERDAKHASVPLRRVRTGELRWEKFLYELKAGPAGGRLRRPSSAGRTTAGHQGWRGANYHTVKGGTYQLVMTLGLAFFLVNDAADE
jgi:hypothetical protein